MWIILSDNLFLGNYMTHGHIPKYKWFRIIFLAFNSIDCFLRSYNSEANLTGAISLINLIVVIYLVIYFSNNLY